ncbi:hypothetical protein F5883DRAFT_669193 [Diaporthe sp. PMI_573]|nr:hypothetical protein F5883DRAFT_669193 [Diaporthaceae sp. PMI_573]
MLAIKFHHIRILIHRPYLFYPHLNRQQDQTILPEQHAQIWDYGNTCVMEAQAIARLMHNVTDTTEIVLNSPWWQMVSCLVAAASVLVLAENFAKHEPSRDEDIPVKTVPGLSEDVDICVQVLHALSSSSNGAKLACSMIRNLRARTTHIPVESAVGPSPGLLQHTEPGLSLSANNRQQRNRETHDVYNDPVDPQSRAATSQTEEMEADIMSDDRFSWPVMIPDWMNWPTEFLESFQGPEDPTQTFHHL